MKRTVIGGALVLLATLTSCNKGMIGTYTAPESEDDLGITTRLVLFEDYTFEYTHWTSLLKSDRGTWTQDADTIYLFRVNRMDTVSFVYDSNKLYDIDAQGMRIDSWEFKKTSRRTSKLLCE